MTRFGCYRWPLLLLVLASLPGCAGQSMGIWPFASGKAKHYPGVISPAEQMETVRQIRKTAGSATAQEREESVQKLSDMLRDERDPMLRAEIIRSLEKYPSDKSLTLIRAGLKDPDANVRLAACECLGRIGGPLSIVVLSEAASGDVDTDVRLAAAKALGETKDAAAAPALARALNDSDPAMQYRAVLSLKNVTGKDLGNNVAAWREYAKSAIPDDGAQPAVAQRPRQSR